MRKEFLFIYIESIFPVLFKVKPINQRIRIEKKHDLCKNVLKHIMVKKIQINVYIGKNMFKRF